MNSPDERWWSVRAGEYVLGTLRDNDLHLFERVLAQDTDVQLQVAQWERKLAGLNQTTPSLTPPEHVWSEILERVRHLDDRTNNVTRDSMPATGSIDPTLDIDKTPPVKSAESVAMSRRIPLWPTIAGLATAASLVLGVLLYQKSTAPAVFLQVDGLAVVLSDENGEPYFLVETDYENGRVRVTALAPPSLDETRDYQLWQAVPDRSSVRAVARLPEEPGTSRTFTVRSLIDGSDLFGVSIEPLDANTDAGPTGPVIAHGDFLPKRDID